MSHGFYTKWFKFPQAAQAASELAIFGAILIFVIGLIVRTGFNTSQNLNQQLRAFRFALTESYKTGEGQYTGRRPSRARNAASILLIEDRLSINGADQLGERDRIPYMTSASGTFSRNLLMPLAFESTQHLPIFDLIVNGQRFPFITSAFKEYDLMTMYRDNEAKHCDHDPHPRGTCWDKNCNGGQGCVIFYTKIVRANAIGKFNSGCEKCFDLDLDGKVDVPSELRTNFHWQWQTVEGLKENIDPANDLNSSMDVDGDLKEESVLEVVGVPPPASDPNATLAAYQAEVAKHANEIQSLKVVDFQEGDVNLGFDDQDAALREEQGLSKRKFGLDDDVAIYAMTKEGTMLRVEQGKLFDPLTSQFIRNTNRQDHAELIQRIFYIDNDTGRFCTSDGQPLQWKYADGSPSEWAKKNAVAGLDNPVEACNNCFSQDNIELTCMDQGKDRPHEGPIIFIRSRIKDLRGRRWVTRLEEFDK